MYKKTTTLSFANLFVDYHVSFCDKILWHAMLGLMALDAFLKPFFLSCKFCQGIWMTRFNMKSWCVWASVGLYIMGGREVVWGDVEWFCFEIYTNNLSLSLDFDFLPFVGYKLRILSWAKFGSIFNVGKPRFGGCFTSIHPSIHSSIHPSLDTR